MRYDDHERLYVIRDDLLVFIPKAGQPVDQIRDQLNRWAVKGTKVIVFPPTTTVTDLRRGDVPVMESPA